MAYSVVYTCCILVYDVITISTLCPRKNYNPVCIAMPITLANNVGF